MSRQRGRGPHDGRPTEGDDFWGPKPREGAPPTRPRTAVEKGSRTEILTEEPPESPAQAWANDAAAESDAGRVAARRQALRRRRRRRNWLVLAIVLALLAPIVVGVGWFWTQLDPMGSAGAATDVSVPDSSSTDDVAKLLQREHVIGSAFVFRAWTAISGSGPYLPGTYTFHRDSGVRDAIAVLDKGPAPIPEDKLLLPPGLTLNQIAERVAQIPGHTAAGFMQVVQSGRIRSRLFPDVTNLEGLLFPDTYFIGRKESDESIVRRLVARFDEIATKAGLASTGTLPNGLTPYQTVVLASLVQTEVKVADEAPIIAAVIVNRIRDNTPLQIDSTLCYAKGGCPPVPTNADKSVDSPYNTYKVRGLPPTPIASVTEANLAAAMAPANVTYRYYVIADANGRHAFANTLAEHNRNVEAARAKGLL